MGISQIIRNINYHLQTYMLPTTYTTLLVLKQRDTKSGFSCSLKNLQQGYQLKL